MMVRAKEFVISGMLLAGVGLASLWPTTTMAKTVGVDEGASAPHLPRNMQRAGYFEAIALAHAFLDGLELSANEATVDDDRLSDARAQACFDQILSEDFVHTIDGVGFGPAPAGSIGGGTVVFSDPQSFIDFANNQLDDVRENLTLQAGAFSFCNVPGEEGDLGFTYGNSPKVGIRTSLSVYQNVLADSFLYGELGPGPSGMIIRARLFFEVTEESPDTWKITRSRMSMLDIARAELLSLPRVTDLDEF